MIIVNAPFYEKIKKYAENSEVRRFHMPGHKGNFDLFDEHITKFDVTELDTTDNLYSPQKELLEAERLASELFGVKRTVFCAGGATLGNQTALSFFEGRKVLFERNIHISVLNAAMLLDIEPVFAYNSINTQTGVVMPVEKQEIEETLRNDPDISAVFITSPNYYGLCADIRGIKQICEKYGVLLITDNSHGTHLAFFDNDSSGSHCSDITVDSAHKTLPVLTGGAFLHFNTNISREEICSKMLAFGSTSPSFLILSSLDKARAWCEENIESFLQTKNNVNNVKSFLRSKNATVVESEICDPIRVCIACENAKETDLQLKKFNFIPEMCDGNCIVFMFTPFNRDSDFTDLIRAFSEIDFKAPIMPVCQSLPETQIVCKMKEAFYGEKTESDIDSAVGRIAAEPIIPYPPGVPILIPGELITEKTAEYIKMYNTDKVKVL